MEDNRNLCIAMPRDLHLRLRRYSLEHDLTLAEIVLRLVRELLEDEENGAGRASPVRPAANKGRNDRRAQ